MTANILDSNKMKSLIKPLLLYSSAQNDPNVLKYCLNIYVGYGAPEGGYTAPPACGFGAGG